MPCAAGRDGMRRSRRRGRAGGQTGGARRDRAGRWRHGGRRRRRRATTAQASEDSARPGSLESSAADHIAASEPVVRPRAIALACTSASSGLADARAQASARAGSARRSSARLAGGGSTTATISRRWAGVARSAASAAIAGSIARRSSSRWTTRAAGSFGVEVELGHALDDDGAVASALDEPGDHQALDGLAHGRAGDAELLAQHPLRRQRAARGEVAGVDGVGQPLADLRRTPCRAGRDRTIGLMVRPYRAARGATRGRHGRRHRARGRRRRRAIGRRGALRTTSAVTGRSCRRQALRRGRTDEPACRGRRGGTMAQHVAPERRRRRRLAARRQRARPPPRRRLERAPPGEAADPRRRRRRRRRRPAPPLVAEHPQHAASRSRHAAAPAPSRAAPGDEQLGAQADLVGEGQQHGGDVLARALVRVGARARGAHVARARGQRRHRRRVGAGGSGGTVAVRTVHVVRRPSAALHLAAQHAGLDRPASDRTVDGVLPAPAEAHRVEQPGGGHRDHRAEQLARRAGQVVARCAAGARRDHGDTAARSSVTRPRSSSVVISLSHGLAGARRPRRWPARACRR